MTEFAVALSLIVAALVYEIARAVLPRIKSTCDDKGE